MVPASAREYQFSANFQLFHNGQKGCRSAGQGILYILFQIAIHPSQKALEKKFVSPFDWLKLRNPFLSRSFLNILCMERVCHGKVIIQVVTPGVTGVPEAGFDPRDIPFATATVLASSTLAGLIPFMISSIACSRNSRRSQLSSLRSQRVT